MKKQEIEKGGHYRAKVSNKLTTVRVDRIDTSVNPITKRSGTVYHVTNIPTGRKTTFRSAAKFLRRVVTPAEKNSTAHAQSIREAALNGSAATATVVPPVKSGLAAKLAERKDVADVPHLIVEARAGTGKTTTLIEGLKRIKGIESNLTPSEQQAEVWKAMELSKGKVQSICFVAFNKSIATELQTKVPIGCDAMTMHSMGNRAVTKAFGRVRLNAYRVDDIISELLGRDIRELRRDKPMVIKATKELVSLCKMNLVGEALGFDAVGYGKPGYEGSTVDSQLITLASHYDVDLNGSASEVFDLVPKIVERCKDVARDGCIDFNDMIWIPVVLDLSVYRYDLLLVDEAQDLNRCQQALAKKAGKRLILCGDPKQAIYGFAGADSESMPRMARELGETPAGCVTLPLTVTRRCGKAIVAESQKIVPDFEAFETNPEGKVSIRSMTDKTPSTVAGDANNYRSWVTDGDMVLCRVNAPLVSECFKFLRQGRKANIQGRDIGQGLISTINKQLAADIPDLLFRLSNWLHTETTKEQAKRNPSDARLIALQDRYDCLVCFCENAKTVDDVIAKINSIFTDDRYGTGIKLSSIHKAKGLEAKRVFLLQPKGAGCPHPMAKTAWQREQEMNLLYVAITRAIEEFVYVS